MSPPWTTPTLRLFVGHGRPLGSQEEENELRALFEREGRVTSLLTKRGQWPNSRVTFETTGDAVHAKRAHQGASFRGMTLRINFARPTRRVLVRGVPLLTAFADLEHAFEGVERVERDGPGFALVFGRISDARDCVTNAQGCW